MLDWLSPVYEVRCSKITKKEENNKKEEEKRRERKKEKRKHAVIISVASQGVRVHETLQNKKHKRKKRK